MIIMSTKDEIVFALKEAKEQYVSGEDLAKKLSISRTAVWKHIETLKQDGYIIESSSRLGYLLKSSPDLMFPAEIQIGLKTKHFGRKINYFSKVDSTNNKAKELVFAGASEGLLVVAEEQVGGRGRLGRSWFSPSGGIWFSLVLRPQIAPGEILKITLMAGIAGVEAIKETIGLEPRIKWPNDLLIKGKKLAGILTEMETEADRIHSVILGMGINANIAWRDFPSHLKETATSMQVQLGKNVDRCRILRAILAKLETGCEQLRSGGFSSIRNSWMEHSDTLGSQVKVETVNGAIKGKAVDISSEGALILELDSGETKAVWSGDVITLG